MKRSLLVLASLLAVLLFPLAPRAVAQDAATGPGPDLTKLCAKLERTPARVPLCTHGPDPAPALGDLAPPVSSGAAATAPLCFDGGVAGKRVEVLYGVPRDRPNRYSDMVATMRTVLADADANLDASDAATTQHYRFLCENGVDVTIRNVTLLAVGGDSSFTWQDYVDSLQHQVLHGLGPTDFVDDDRVYMTFVDQISSVYPYGGQGSIFNDDRPDPALNNNNRYAKYSMTAYFDARIVGHEIGHNIGAAQLSAPHSSGGYHCHDDSDLMCYQDGGSYFQNGGQMTYPCPGVHEVHMDCGRDDYYYPGAPPATNYLATHWNTADSGFLTRLVPGTTSVPSVPSSVVVSVDEVVRSASIGWGPPASDGGSVVTGYRVSRTGTDASGGGPTSSTVGASVRSFTFSSLVAGATYELSVQAVNAVGVGVAAVRAVTVGGGSTRTVVLSPVADSMARQQAPGTVSGSVTSLVADVEETSGSATRATPYLRFAVPGLAAGESITGAQLSVHVSNGTPNGPAVWRTDAVWDEGTLSWSGGQPARVGTAAVANFPGMATGRVAVAVAGVSGGEEVSLQLHAESSDGLVFASRESTTTANRPQLVLTITT